MSVLEATMLMPPKLRFDAAIPSRTHIDAYPGLRTHGPFDSSRVSLPPQSVLFVFPSALQPLAHQLAAAIRNGHGSVPSFQTLFGVPLTGETMTSLAIDAELGSLENSITNNTMTANGTWDCQDDSAGTHNGPAMTANQWTGDFGFTENRPGLCHHT